MLILWLYFNFSFWKFSTIVGIETTLMKSLIANLIRKTNDILVVWIDKRMKPSFHSTSTTTKKKSKDELSCASEYEKERK
jgi:hypothetical protein